MEAKLESITFFLSASLSQFLKKVELEAKHILAYEMGLKVCRSRFTHKGYTYPIKLLLFEGSQKLGFFDPMTLEIGLNKACAHAKQASWLDVLRHELSHYLTFIEYGITKHAHGPEFIATIKKYGFSDEVQRGYGQLETDPVKQKQSEMEKKLHKVMSLAKSHHVKEAQAALNKMRELTEKYQLENRAWEDKISPTAYMRRALEFKRVSGKIKAIQAILRTFFVTPVLNKGYKGGYLEVVGTKHDCEIACFVAHFLDHKLEQLWKSHRDLKGTRAKNSFFLGISKGYLAQKELKKAATKELILLQTQIEAMADQFYPHLSSIRTSAQLSHAAFSQGKKEGSALSIAKALKTVIQNPLLPFKR